MLIFSVSDTIVFVPDYGYMFGIIIRQHPFFDSGHAELSTSSPHPEEITYTENGKPLLKTLVILMKIGFYLPWGMTEVASDLKMIWAYGYGSVREN